MEISHKLEEKIRNEYGDAQEDSCMLSGDSGYNKRHYSRDARTWFGRSHVATAAVSIISTAAVCLLGLMWFRASTSLLGCVPRTDHLGFLPSSDVLEYESYLPGPKAWKDSPYAGPPSDEKGLAWDQLQQVRGCRVSKDEGRQIHLPGGLQVDHDTHATILGVMHNLHCLRMIRQYLYPDYYYSQLDRTGLEKMRNHSDHCIETLRESVMCLPDLTPHALEWADKDEMVHVNLKPTVERQCVKWDSLVTWQHRREYHLDDIWQAEQEI